MKSIIIVGIALAIGGCAVLTKPVPVNVRPIEIDLFTQQPFGHNEKIADFTHSMPKGTRVQKLIKRIPKSQHRPDTIYNFIYRKSKVSIYKTRFNQEFFLGAVVNNPELELTNGIRTGMTREQFMSSLPSLPSNHKDTISIQDPNTNRSFSFVFSKRGKLKKFSLTGNQK